MRDAKGRFLKGSILGIRTQIKKGATPWNKGKKNVYNTATLLIMSQKKRGVSSPRKGIKLTDELKKRLSVVHKGQIAWNKGLTYEAPWQKAEKNHSWKGGITKERLRIYNSFQYKTWRIEVFKRDSYTCRECKETGGILNADHIMPFAYYPELRFSVENGRTLCIDCHRKTETFGSRYYKTAVKYGLLPNTS